MDFELSADQVALAEGVRQFCEGRFDRPTIRGWAEGAALDRGRWAELASLGVFGLRLPEQDGGVGLGMAEAVLVFEELGRALVPGPLVWTHLAAGLVEGAAEGEVIVGGIERSDPSRLVEYGEDIDELVVLDDEGIWRVRRGDVDLTPVALPLDPLTPVSVVGSLPVGERIGDAELARRWRLEGTALVAGALLGLSGAVTEAAVAFATEREQFGRPIGSFQSLKHLMADMLVRTEVARGAVYAAGVTLDDPEVGSPERASLAAKLTAAEAACTNAASSVQVHGGMGYTWEVDAHLYFKRAHVWEPAFGGRPEMAERMAALIDAG